MKPARFVSSYFTLLSVLASLSLSLHAQAPSRLVTKPVDETRLVTLRGNVHPLAQARYDLGAVSPEVPAKRMLLLLGRPSEQETALARYLKDVHTPGSASYHQWLTPEEFGKRFGPVDSDIEAVSGWLSDKGFQVAQVSKGKTLIEFSGTVGQVNEAFHTEIHRYQVNDELHYANATDPQIPEALSGIVRGLSPLNDFHARPAIHVAGPAHRDPATNKIFPDFTLSGPNGSFFGLAPEDFATQYDLGPLYAAGINGSGKTIGIINDSNIDVSRDSAYRSLFNLPSNPAQVVVDGGDPGVNGDAVEAYLDVEAAGAVAPGATVNLYIASSDGLDVPLILAAARAISDNQADVLSVSFLNCEAHLGTNGNQLFNSLWQQAAAQGQTVLVATGDDGSASCDAQEGAIARVSHGLTVSGLASTPWNVAVGGTDFFYSDYASGAPSAGSHWNSTNDAGNGSLKAPLPEQVWNNAFGFNAVPQSPNIVAGGGGVSTVYTKPSWQTGAGVPSDGQRDLPDVSLFAANGANLSGWVICVNPGDCTPSNGQILVTIVGGTSASTPAMAGIMALINQKHGRQGQANYVLYPLAQQMPSAFHDITMGGNNVPCVPASPRAPASPDCVVGTGTTDNGQPTLSGYPATTGYDMASGIGSVDGNVLVSDWGNITFLPTITTLQLSSTTFTHGTPVTFTADVTHSSGSASPTGSVSLLSNSPLPFNQTQGMLTLGSNGTASGSLATLPGGSYEVWASYPGDGVYSGGTSSPVSVTVMPEASSIAIAGVGFGGQPVPSGSSTSDGQPFLLTVQPKGTSGQKLATGSVAFTLDSQPAVSVPLNVNGIASWLTPATAVVGSHTVTASYSGDTSYNSSQSSPFTYNVLQGHSGLFLGLGGVCGTTAATANTCTAFAGDTIPIEVDLQLSGTQANTGTVSVTVGSQSQMATLSPEGKFGAQALTGVVNFSNLAPGTYPVSASYTGDNNYAAASVSGGPFSLVVQAATGTRAATTTTVTESSSIVQGGTTTDFTVTVTGSGSSGPPTGSVTIYTNGLGLPPISLTQSSPNSSSGSSGPEPLQSFNLGQNLITAVYTGDSTHQESISSAISLTAVTPGQLPDFTLTPQLPQFVVPKGNSASAPLNLTSLFGFSGTVDLSCTPSDASITCNVTPASVNVNETATATAQLMVTSTGTAAALHNTLPTSGARMWPLTSSSLVLGFIFLAGGRKARRNPRFLMTLAVLSLFVICVACGGGGTTSMTPPPPPPPTPPTPLNAHSVLVTATANGVVHNAKVIVVIQ
jgi:subtilase family serine protease